MADDLNLMLKAILDVAESKKDIKLVIDSLNKSDIGTIKFNTSVDTSKIKKDLDGIKTAFTTIEVDGALKKDITTIEKSVGKLKEITREYGEEGTKVTEKNKTSYKQQNELIKKATQLQNELNIASQKFTVKNLDDLYKLNGFLDVSEVQKISDSFKNIKIADDGSNLKEVNNEVKLLNKQYDLLIDKAKFQQKIYKDRIKDVEKEKELYLEITRILKTLPEGIDKNIADSYLEQLDNTKGIDGLTELKSSVENYYKDVIALEQQYNNLKLKASKDEQERLDFLYQQNKRLLNIKEQIRVAETRKGLNTDLTNDKDESINSTMVSLESKLNDLTETGIILTKEKRQEIIEISDKLQQQLKYQTNDLAILNQQENVYKKINTNIDNLNAVKAKDSNVNNLIASWTDLEKQVRNGSISLQDANIKMNDLEVQTKKATASNNRFGLSVKNLIKYSLFYDSLGLAKRALTEVITEVKALDDSLLEVNKIIDLSDQEMQNFVKSAYDMGDAISRTGRDMIDATATIVKSGIDDLDDAMQYGKLALSIKNVGEGMTDVENNAKVLISVMKGFGNESVDFAEKTVNILNKVSNESAIEFKDLAEGFSRTSAVFSQSGVSIQQTAGLLTGVNEVLQNIEKSSSGLLTLSQRIQGVSDSFEEDPENLSKLDSALKSIANVDIQDSTGQLRDTYSILNDIADVYPTLTKNQQAYLGELIAGKRQRNVFESLMINWSAVEKATQSATNSAGSYAKEQEAYFESISGHLARLESAWQSLTTNSLDSSFIKSIVDFGTTIVKVIDYSGGLEVALIALASAFVLVNKSAVSGFISGLIEQMVALTTATTTATGATVALSLAQKLLIGGAVVAGIMAVGYGINKIANASKDAKQEVQTLSDEIKTMKDTENSIESLSKRYNELKNTQNKTTEQAQEYIDVQNKLKGLLPELNGYYNTLGDFQIAENDNLKELMSNYKEYIKLKRDEKAEAVEKSAKWTSLDFDMARSDFERMKRLENQYNGILNSGKSQSEIEKSIKSLELHSGIAFANIGEEIEKARQKMQGFGSTMSSEVMDFIKATDDWDKLSIDQQNAISKAFSEQNLTDIEEYHDLMKDNKLISQEFIDELIQTYPALEYLSDIIKGTKTDSEEATEAISNLSEAISIFSNKQKLFESVQNEIGKNNSLSLDSVQDLIDIYPQLENVLYDYLAGLATTSEVMAEVDKAYLVDENNYKNAVATKQKYNEEFYNNTANLGGKLVKAFSDSYGIDLSNCKNLAEAKLKVEQETVKSIATLWQKYYDSQKQDFNSAFYNKMPEEYDTRASKELYNTLTDYKNLVDERIVNLDNIVYEGITIPTINSSSVSSATSKAEEDVKTYTETVIDEFNKANKEIERNLTQLDLSQQLVNDDSQEYIDIEKKKYDEIIKLETLLQEKIGLLQAENTEESKQQVEEYIDLYYDTVQQRYSIIANLQSSQISLFENQIESLEKQKSAMEDLHDLTMQMIKDELNAKKKSYQEELKGIEAVFNAKKKALRDEQDTRSYEKGLTEKSSLVADLENQLAIIKNDETAIAKRKKLEEELFKVKQDLADYQYDHSIDIAEKALDEKLEIEKSKLEEEITEIDNTLSNEVEMREEANKRIERSGQKLKDQLIKHAKEYGTFTIEEVTNAWEIAGSAVDDFDTKQQNLLETLKLLTAELEKIQGLNVKDYANKSGLSTKTVGQTKSEMKINSAKWLDASKNNDTKKMEDMAKANQDLGNAMGWYYDPVTGIWWENKDKKKRIYHSGGIVGGDFYATKSTEELAKLLKGELVITPPQADKVMDMITNNNSNSESFAPEINIIIEGNADGSVIDLLKKESKNIANMVAEEFSKSRANRGYKTKLKPI